ncbi:MAG: hypothetical protein JWM86_1683 [Thermoleophilia bacterium]|nr:hypothetical protein [Thermoleophilia bacterium]
MRVRSASDLTATVIVWLPILAVAVGVMYIFAVGVLNLEMRSFGTEYLIPNSATSNLPEGAGPSNEQILQAAIDTGDPAQMEAALDQVEARTTALAAR